MKILYPGHRYALPNLDGSGEQIIQFVQRPPFHAPRAGILNQQLLAILIDRIEHLHREKPWEGNARILQHLRIAIAEHECRALIRHVEDGKLLPELVKTGPDGHFKLG